MANIKISQLVSSVPGQQSVFPFTDNGITYKGFVSGLTSNYVEVTKNELISLTQTSSLIQGYFYIISGVDVNLYGGTTIILECVAPNKLSETGVGLFYNPKYNQTVYGYGVWTRNMTPTFDSVSGGIFIPNETVTCELGGIAIYLTDELLEWVNGDWDGATSITGNTSGTIATISRSLSPNYSFGDDSSSSVIWGGKLWVNQSGFILNESVGTGDGTPNYSGITQNIPITPSSLSIDTGIESFTENGSGILTGDSGGVGVINYINGEWTLSTFSGVSIGYDITASYTASTNGISVNKYELSSVWESVTFNDFDYNLVADQIIYDYDKDKIIHRRDKFNNEVSCTYQSISLFEINNYGNPIKDFQWGNNQTNWGNETGLFLFNDVPTTNDEIQYGGNDLFDTGNLLNTDLFSQIPYTHTQMVDPPVHSNEETSSIYFYSDGLVQSGDTYFGVGSEYFTNLYPGLFVMAANNISVNEFFIDGSLGTDCDSDLDFYQKTYDGFSEPYTVFVKRYSNNLNSEPSNNHMIIVNGDGVGITHDYSSGGCDSDFDMLSGLTSANVTKIYYLLMSLSPTEKISDNEIDNVVQTFLDIVDEKTFTEGIDSLSTDYLSITLSFNQSQTTNKFGVMGNKVTDSYFDCLNFQGGYLWNNNLNQNSIFNNNNLTSNGTSNFSFNNLNSESIFSNNIIGTDFEFIYNKLFNTLISNNNIGNYAGVSSEFLHNILEYSNFSNNILHNTHITKNSFLVGSEMLDNTMDSSGIFNNIIGIDCRFENNLLVLSQCVENNLNESSSIINNTLLSSQISGNKLNNSSIENNDLFNNGLIQYNNLLFSSSIQTNLLTGNTSVAFNNLEQNSSIQSNTGLTNSNISQNNLFYGSISQNNFDNNCAIRENEITNFSEVSINFLSDSCDIQNNIINNGGYILSNNLVNVSEIQNNNLNISFVWENTLSGSTISVNDLNSYSEIHSNILSGSKIWKNNLSIESFIFNGNLTNSSEVSYNSSKNTIINLESSCLLDSKSITKNNFVDSIVDDISENSIVIYDLYSKNIFTNSTGGTRISYYDGSDSLIIGNINDSILPTLNITGWTAVSSYNIDVYINITLDGGNSVTERGSVWSLSPYPTISDNIVIEGGTGIGAYTSNLTGLTPSSTIYFRGYAVNSSGTGYTCQNSYNTP